MKKWLTTYLLIFCGICLHVYGFANPAKRNYQGDNISGYTKSPRTFTFKKASPLLYDYPDAKDACIFFRQNGIRYLNTVVPYYIVESNFFISVSCHVPGEAMNTRGVERVLKDHLLHLFPSHYFW